MVVRFGAVELDLDRIEVRVAGVLQPVQPQVFDVIRYLFERRERLVTKEELLDNVWGDRFVSESTLTSRIKSARRVLGDNGRDQAIIRTVHGRGYRFVAEPDAPEGGVTEAPPAAPVAVPPSSADLTIREADGWPLVGRYELLDRIGDVLAEPGVGGIVLVGPTGIGKTRLAIETLRARALDGGPTARLTASAAAAAIPLAALAPLIGPRTAAVDGLAPDVARSTMFHRALAELADRAAGAGRLLVMVDDVDRLDELSAAVLAAAMEADSVSLLGTTRAASTPHPFEELVRAGRVHALEVPPLDETDVDVMLYRVLEGPIDLASLERLSELSRGVPGLLRDLVVSSQASGALAREDGVWRLIGPVTSSASAAWPPPGLGPEAVTAAELLSLVANLHVADADAVLGDTALDALDGNGLLAVTRQDGETFVGLADPLLAEHVAASIGPMRVRRHKETLMDALTGGRRRPEDIAAVVRWADELERPLDPVDALTAAQLALRQGSDAAADVLVDQFAESGAEAGPYPTVIRAELAYRRAQYRRAEELFERVDLAAVDGATAAFVYRRMATMRYQVHADYRGSVDWLAAQEAGAPPRLAASLRAHRVTLLTLIGAADEALATAAPLIADARGARAIEVQLSSARARVLRGELDAALAIVDAQEAQIAEVNLSGPEARLPAEGALSIRLTALLHRGDVQIAERLLQDNLVLGSRTSRSWSPLSAAEVALEVGRPRAAVELIRPTLEMYRAQGMDNGRIACTALLGRAHAELGWRDAAERAFDELVRDLPIVVGANRWYVADALARVAVVLGRGPECVGVLVEEAAVAADWGARTSAANLLALAAVADPRRTAPAIADRVADLAAGIDGRLWPIRVAHVRALAEGRPCDGIRSDFLALGYRGFAALATDAGRAVAGPA